ncbi:type II toxin-antitoxin system ParD family antitoxin, partial [Salmonella enterica subsp. enterica serovar Cerro]|nr:type II toxin-antitoxin system ParD family antitoxin [Salmonella enterica subsp. enterica serovar Cerro]
MFAQPEDNGFCDERRDSSQNDLGDELREFIESLIESGDYRTQSEVIRESLRLLREKQAESRL